MPGYQAVPPPATGYFNQHSQSYSQYKKPEQSQNQDQSKPANQQAPLVGPDYGYGYQSHTMTGPSDYYSSGAYPAPPGTTSFGPPGTNNQGYGYAQSAYPNLGGYISSTASTNYNYK
ncbi:hypothetical protein DNTS_029771 [Danionella cerebrum]|uniref:Uncharacterized protein n=1 Tax=Danionella cerebrum TaxID=2873325 RepID=A0A553QQU3_9TELE|nr:hypothetical protein DNTS_029771 [Danionella translucida]